MNPETPRTKTVTRFAPSPTGHLHVGHAYAALFAERAAREPNGRFLLRIEDIDVDRCRAEFEDAIYEDLAWIGLTWETPVRRQSDQAGDYAKALEGLRTRDLIYPCFCTRKQILAEFEAAGGAPHSAEGPIYPGTCRGLSADEQHSRIASGEAHALRLHMDAAADLAGALSWVERETGEVEAAPRQFGDVVLARKDFPNSYHLACTLDDHAQGVTRVTRGDDLSFATHIHRLLQELLGLDTPEYHHHPLLTDEAGNRLAKRDKSITIRSLREAGHTPSDVRRMAGFAD